MTVGNTLMLHEIVNIKQQTKSLFCRAERTKHMSILGADYKYFIVEITTSNRLVFRENATTAVNKWTKSQFGRDKTKHPY